MAFERGRYGLLYRPHDGEEKHLLRWVVSGAAALVLIAFICYKVKSRTKGPDAEPRPRMPPAALQPPAPARQETAPTPAPAPRAAPPRPSAQDAASPATSRRDAPAAQPKPATIPVASPASQPKDAKPPRTKISPAAQALVDRILKTLEDRPRGDQVLLRKLVEAEQQGNAKIAVDTIQKLSRRPTMADLKDPLMRRLGDLNLELLLSGQPTPWTTIATVRRGDGRERIAREHRTTPAAVARLNPDVKWERLQPGDSVRVLDFPSAALVVYGDGTADLSLNKNGQFFRRYYLSVSKTAKSGVYPIESGASPASRFRELGMKLAPRDRSELEMFLAPGSRIVVSSGQ